MDSSKKILFKKLLFPLGISLLIALSLLIIIGIKNFIPIIAFTSIGFALSSICYEWISDTKIRISSGDKIITAWWNLINSNRPRHGGYIVHISIIMIGMGVIGTNFFEERTDQAIHLKESVVLDNYRIEYIDLIQESRSDRITNSAYMNVYKINPIQYKEYSPENTNGFKITKKEISPDDKNIGTIMLKHEFYPSFNQISVRSGILSTPIEDIYVIPRDFLDDGRIGVAVSINPLAWWLWAAGPFFIFGTMFALWPSRSDIKKKTKLWHEGLVHPSYSLKGAKGPLLENHINHFMSKDISELLLKKYAHGFSKFFKK